MTAEALLKIVETRMACDDGNPTTRSFLFELHGALERLDKYEKTDNNCDRCEKIDTVAEEG